MAGPSSFDVVIVGGGIAGLYMLHKTREQGLTARVYEAGSGIGGTWFWNRYPGARVDIESQEYSYSFSEELENEWQWSERYASQPELLRYVNFVADKFDLRRDVQLNTRIASAHFDEKSLKWAVKTDQGEAITARFVVMATGVLSVAKEPDIAGLASFAGKTYHTNRWPEGGVDFTGQRVGVIGTGSTAIQAIPILAEQAKHLTVFQRTPNFSVPAHNAPHDPNVARDWAANRAKYRAEARDAGFAIRMVQQREDLSLEATPEERRKQFEERWNYGGFALLGAYSDLVFVPEANETAVEFVHSKIDEIVKDPAVAEKLKPRSYPIGSKRICVDTGYYATFNRDNVTLVDIAEAPIETVTAKGVRTKDAEYELDAIVLATGFDAMTGALGKIDIRGRGNRALKEKWADGPRTYLGLMMAGFPNLFIVTGPGSPSVLSNMIMSIEQHVEWIADCLRYLSERQLGAIEATETAETNWVAHVNEVADLTLFPRANSWYVGANVPGKPRVFMPYIGGFPLYRQTCADVAAKDYEGCTLTPA